MLVPRPPHADWTLANAFHGVPGPRLQIFFQQDDSSVAAEACESQRPDSLQLRSSGSNPGRRALQSVPHTVPMSEQPGQEPGTAFRRSDSQSGPLLSPIRRRRRQACHVIALCMSCQSFDSGLPLGWGSCSQPSALRSLIWSWLGLYLAAERQACAARVSCAGSSCSRQRPSGGLSMPPLQARSSHGTRDTGLPASLVWQGYSLWFLCVWAALLLKWPRCSGNTFQTCPFCHTLSASVPSSWRSRPPVCSGHTSSA